MENPNCENGPDWTEETPTLSALSASPGSRWKSCADWGDYDICNGYQHNITTDEHDTEGQAAAVCKMLKEQGYGGRGQVFPVRVWTEEIPSENPQLTQSDE